MAAADGETRGNRRRNQTVDLLVEQLAALGPVASRAMFGGFGLFLDGCMFAIVLDDVPRLKVTDANRSRFAAAHCSPFTYARSGGRTITMDYWTIPVDVLEDRDLLIEWARTSVAVAKPAAPKKARTSRKPGAAAKPVAKPKCAP